MHSFLIANPPDITLNQDVLEIRPETSIGIEDIRGITLFLSRKPVASDKNIIVIHDAHKMTLPAQNAILKTLEEPPSSSQIYLITAYPDQLLPTILSRVQIIESSAKPEVDQAQLTQSLNLLNQLLSSTPGERIALLETQKFTRDTALDFISDLEIILHQKIGDNPYTLNPDLYTLIIESRKYLTANVNLRLILTHLALRI